MSDARFVRFLGRVKNIFPKRTRIFRDLGDYAESLFPRRKAEPPEGGAFAGVEQAGTYSVFHAGGLDGAGAWVVTYRSVSNLILNYPATISLRGAQLMSELVSLTRDG